MFCHVRSGAQLRMIRYVMFRQIRKLLRKFLAHPLGNEQVGYGDGQLAEEQVDLYECKKITDARLSCLARLPRLARCISMVCPASRCREQSSSGRACTFVSRPDSRLSHKPTEWRRKFALGKIDG